jgi:DNA mismatch repair protein MutS
MGDFYELFYDDARKAGAAARHHPDPARSSAGQPIRWRACRSMRTRGISRAWSRSAKSVAICEQIGDPATSKGLVERKVVRIVTPGT